MLFYPNFDVNSPLILTKRCVVKYAGLQFVTKFKNQPSAYRAQYDLFCIINK